MWRWVLGVLALCGLLLASWLLDPRLPGGARELDRDGSGTLSRDEAGPVLRQQFQAIDRADSGEISGRDLRRFILRQWLTGAARPMPVPDLPAERDPDALRAWLDAGVTEGGLNGVGLILLRDGERVFQHVAGDLDPTEPLALEAASMWPTAALFACLEGRGDLDLDAPLSAIMELPGRWNDMSLLQILSHQAGTPASMGVEFAGETSMERAAQALMARYPPEADAEPFAHGGVGMQVAGWLAETAADRSWRRLFIECMGWPMSLDSAAWGHPRLGPDRHGFLSPAYGLHMSLEDYGRFLAMLQQDGRYAGVGVLPPEAVERLLPQRIAARDIRERPAWADPDWGYALGAWCERPDRVRSGRDRSGRDRSGRDRSGRDEDCARLSSPGSWGVWPWWDRDRNLAGVLVTVDHLPRVRAWMDATRTLADDSF